MRNEKQGMIDVQDLRLTASERHTLRQILLRLQSWKPSQPQMCKVSPRQTDLEEAIAEVFGSKN